MENIGQAFDLRPVNLRRRRFLMASTAMLAVLGIAMGVSFLATTGEISVTASAVSTNWVFPVSATGSVPAAVDELKYSGSGLIAEATNDGAGDDWSGTPDTPSWSPVSDSAATLSATNAGDLAIIDATTSNLVLTVYLTDLHELQQAYSSFAFNVNIWHCSTAAAGDDDDTANGAGCDSTGDWAQAGTDVVPAGGTLLTNTDGFLEFTLTTDGYYVITLDAGGTYYAFDTSTADNISPEFYFAAKAIG